MLGFFVAIMGADGVNSTLQDLRVPYLYEPDNRLRLATGLLMGVTLGIMQAYLLNRTVWSHPAEMPLLRGWRELGALLAAQILFYLLVISGWGALRTPLALALFGGIRRAAVRYAPAPTGRTTRQRGGGGRGDGTDPVRRVQSR